MGVIDGNSTGWAPGLSTRQHQSLKRECQWGVVGLHCGVGGLSSSLRAQPASILRENQQKARSSNICTRFIVKGTRRLELEGGGGRGNSCLWLTENVTYAGELREYSRTVNPNTRDNLEKNKTFLSLLKKVFSRKFMSRCCRDDKFNKATDLDFSDNDMKNQHNQEPVFHGVVKRCF